MSKNSEITVQTKQNLIEAFWTLYCEQRIEKITVKDIAAKAGYNRSTFYEYFSDVYDVLEQIEQSLIPTFDALPPINIGTQSKGMPMDVFIDLYEQNSKYYSVLLGDRGDPAFSSKLKNSIKPMLIEELSNSVKVSRMELDYVLEYTLSAMIGMMSYWFGQKDKLDTLKLHELIQRLSEKGVVDVLK